jgi:hypothetical protein
MEDDMTGQDYRAPAKAEAEKPQRKPATSGHALVLTEGTAARRLGVSLRHLQRLRVAGGGPHYIRLGQRRIGYRPADLNRWLETHRVALVPAGDPTERAPR